MSTLTEFKQPEYLQDVDSLKTYMRRKADGMTTKQKGDIFADLVEHLFVLVPEMKDFNRPHKNPQSGSHDLGTDLIATKPQDPSQILHIQARWNLDRTEDIAGILSKFSAFREPIQRDESTQMPLNFVTLDERSHYMIATLDRLDSLIRLFEKNTSHPVFPFYQKIKDEGRFHVLDGWRILELLQSEWRRSSLSRMSTSLKSSAGGWLHQDNVHVGVVSGAEIQELHKKYGSSIFFDNIRDYLGHAYDGADDPDAVNDAIMATLKHKTDKMLARNNGIVMRATSITLNQETGRLELDDMSIVNGCQTTMSIVNSGDDGKRCHVLVKAVQITDEDEHWDITRTANMQNEVSRIELDLAQWLRPQLVRLAAHHEDLAFESPDVFTFLSSINRNRVQYDNIRAMFIGLFSAAPYNIVKRDRNLVQSEIVKIYYENDPKGTHLFSVLFKLHAVAQKGKITAERIFANTERSDLFARFLDENKAFISFLAILAACACIDTDISKFSKRYAHEASDNLATFINKLDEVLDFHETKIEEYFLAAYSAVSNFITTKHVDDQVSRIRQHMTTTLERANFSLLISETQGMYRFRNTK